MNPVFSRLLGVLRSPAGWSALVLVLLGLLVWTLGPMISVNGHAIWGSRWSRAGTIALLATPWLLWRAISYWRKRPKPLPPTAEQQQQREQQVDVHLALHQRAILAQQQLQQAGMSANQRRKQPWYLLIGPQGAGRSSLLAQPDLQLLCSTAEAPQGNAGISPAEWHCHRAGALIDCSGHCLPEADTDQPAPQWQALISLLRQRRQPALTGVIITLPVDLLQQGHDLELDNLARRLRQALSELRSQLGLDLPVYLLISKSDLIPGLTELLEQLPAEQRQQHFGLRLEIDSQADSDQRTQAYAALLGRLNAQMLPRLHQERDPSRRGRLLDLPWQLARLEGPVQRFIEQTFSASRYQTGSRLQGLYFTCGGQSEQDSLMYAPGPTRQAGFVTELFEQIILGNPHQVTLDASREQRQRRRQRIGLGLAAAGLACCAVGWSWAYHQQSERLSQLANLAEHFLPSTPQIQAHSRITALLQQLDTRYAATLVHPEASDRALTRNLTLEQAPEVLPQVQRHYQQALRNYLLPLMTRQLEARLRSAHADRQQLIGHLRAYLMLSQPERLDTDYLQQWMREEWQHRYPEQSDVQAQLSAHLERLLALPWQPAAADQELVTRVREQLQQESLAQLTYRLLREQARALPSYRLDNQLGTDYQLLASRPTSIPGFYTRPGYQSLFQQQGPALIERLLEDNWVLGNRSQLTPSEQRQLLVEVEALYFQDYTDQWVRALASLRMAALRNGRAVSDLSALSASSAPQLLLLQQLREHTRLIDPQLDHAAPASPAKQALQQQFADLHGLIDNDGNPTAVLLQSQQALTQLQLQLAQLYNSGDSGQLAFEMARKRMQHQADAISATRDAASALPAPLNGWINQLASDAWGQVLADAGRYLNQRYRSDLYSVYRSAFAQRYPFSADSSRDVELNDFRRFFQQEGTVEQFVASYLEPFVIQRDGRYRLRSLDGRSLPLSSALLTQLGRAQAIRAGFFADDPFEPGVQFRLEPYALDASLGRASFHYGPEQLEYRHGPIVASAFRWPAAEGSERISLTLEDLGGRRLGLQQEAGTWSLFRLLDRIDIQRQEERDALLLRASIGGMRAQYLLHSQRAPNPFDPALLRSFALPAHL